MATAKDEVTTILGYGDIKQTWVTLDEAPKKISPEVWEHIRKLFADRSQNWDEPWYRTIAQCTPSREGLYSAVQIPSKYLQDAPPILVEEDNVFSLRKVEIVA